VKEIQGILPGSALFAADELEDSVSTKATAAPIARGGRFVQRPWERYKFVRHDYNYTGWCDTDHKYPTPETSRWDRLANDLGSRSFKPTQEIVDKAYHVAVRRNSTPGLRNQRASDRDDVSIHHFGVLAEWAVSTYRKMPYVATINTFKKADLPGRVEVRCWTSWDYMERFGLKVVDRDSDHWHVVQCVCQQIGGVIVVVCWKWAHEAKAYAYKDPGARGKPFHGVPEEECYDMKTLDNYKGPVIHYVP
jgi:hypothetical protein